MKTKTNQPHKTSTTKPKDDRTMLQIRRSLAFGGERNQKAEVPRIAEQVRVLKEIIAMFRLSYTDMIGPTKGQITEPGVARQIECVETSVLLLKKIKGLVAAAEYVPEDDR